MGVAPLPSFWPPSAVWGTESSFSAFGFSACLAGVGGGGYSTLRCRPGGGVDFLPASQGVQGFGFQYTPSGGGSKNVPRARLILSL